MANIAYWLYGASIVVGFCLLAWVAGYAWQRRVQPIARGFAVLVFSMAAYNLTFVVITYSNNIDLAYWAARLRMIPASVTYLIYFAVIMDYAGRDGWGFLRRHPYLFIIPTITILLSLSPQVDEWLFADWQLNPAGPINIETLHFRGFYYVHLTQYYLAVVVGLGVLIRQAVVRDGIYRRHAIPNIVVIVLAVATGLQRNIHWMPDMPNLFPIGLLLMALVLGWSIFSFQLLDLLPIAYHTIFEQMQDAAVVVDREGRITDINPAAAKVIPTNHVIGQRLTVVLPPLTVVLPPNAAESPLDVYLGGAEDARCYEVRATPLHRLKQQTAGHLLILTDITKRKQAEREREEMIVALDAYAHTVAHDLKSPMALILGYASLLNEELDNDPNGLQQYATHIITASQKNVQIINELLMFASVRRRQDITVAPIDMDRLLEAVLRRLQPNREYPDAQITIQPNLPTALGYAAWLEEVWVNLISNALKYGGTPPVIEVGGQPVAGRLRFWVRDNGIGLTREEAHQLLTQEGRLKKHAGQGGHGFGLAITRSIVERLGGAVGVESEVGKGSTFYFTLPAVEDTPT